MPFFVLYNFARGKSSRLFVHTVHVVLEIAILKPVFLDGTDLPGVGDEVIYMHCIRLIGLKHTLETVGLITLRTVLNLDNSPFILLCLTVKPSALNLEVEGEDTELTVNLIVVMIDGTHGIRYGILEKSAIPTKVDIPGVKILPFALHPEEEPLAQPIRGEDRKTRSFRALLGYIDDLAELTTTCPPGFRAL